MQCTNNRLNLLKIKTKIKNNPIEISKQKPAEGEQPHALASSAAPDHLIRTWEHNRVGQGGHGTVTC